MESKNWFHTKQNCCCPVCISKPLKKDVTTVTNTPSYIANSFNKDVNGKIISDITYDKISNTSKHTVGNKLSCGKPRDLLNVDHDTVCSCGHSSYMANKKSYVTMTSIPSSVPSRNCSNENRATYRKNLDQIKPYMTVKMKSSFHVNSGSYKRRRKRHRTAFTPTQLLGLENAFERGHYLVGDERKQLAEFLRLSETQIKVWFQNRRTKFKRQRQNEFADDFYDDIPLTENLVECLEALSANHGC